jgi:hypothetical protein
VNRTSPRLSTFITEGWTEGGLSEVSFLTTSSRAGCAPPEAPRRFLIRVYRAGPAG